MPAAWRADRPDERPRRRPSSACRRRRFCAAGRRSRQDLVPVHLCFVAKLVRLRDEKPRVPAAHRLLALAHILAHRGLADNNLRLLLSQPRPNAMRRVPLLARGSTIRFQNRVDERQRRGQLRSLPLWLLPLWRHCAGQSLPHFPPMNTQSPRYRAIVPAPCSYSRRYARIVPPCSSLCSSRPRFRADNPQKQDNGLRLQGGPNETIERGQFRVAKSAARAEFQRLSQDGDAVLCISVITEAEVALWNGKTLSVSRPLFGNRGAIRQFPKFFRGVPMRRAAYAQARAYSNHRGLQLPLWIC